MRFFITILAASVAAVSAQSIGDAPACAQFCIIAPDACGPNLTDAEATECVCKNAAAQDSITACVQKPVAGGGCSAFDQATLQAIESNVCPGGTGSEISGASETGGAAETFMPTGSGIVSSGDQTSPATTTRASSGTFTTATKPPGDSASFIGASFGAVAAAVFAMALCSQ